MWESSGVRVLGVMCLLGACASGEELGRDAGETDTDATASSFPATDSGGPTDGDSTMGATDSQGPTGSDSDTDTDTATGGGPQGACEDTDATETPSALAFDGVDDHVTMGEAPQLGLETFTVEAWVRRDGQGSRMGTGVGGLQLVPIAGKGRGENDDTIYNCNYALGFNGNVIGADFEDNESGGNHPVVGTTAIAWGQWHHVAATYDGQTWRLYVDGEIDAQVTANATPRADSVQHFAIGTAMNSEGTPAGFFEGAIDEVRVWDHARSQTEVAEAMYQRVTEGEGLVSRWALDADDGGAPDSTGNSPGTIEGASFIDEGAVLDHGPPPLVAPTSPENDATVTVDEAALGLSIDAPHAEDFVVTFHLREVSDQDDFTIVVLPDTQYYSDTQTPHGGEPQHFHDQTQWVRDNREAYNILAVIHNGDIVNHGSNTSEWAVADAAMARLEAPEDDLPDGVPYGVCIGNHDQDVTGEDGLTVTFNQYFGVDRFAARWYYGGSYANTNDENWFTFDAGGLKFVVVNLQYDTTPDPAVLDWARTVFEAHPDAFGVLNSHYIVRGNGEFGPQGQAIYDALKATPNVHLMTSGHISSEARRTDVYQGHVIHSMLADYQFEGDGGGGYLRIWEFSPANDELTVRSYSPSLDDWLIDDDSEFTLEVDLPGSGTDFSQVAEVDPAPHDVQVALDDLEPGRTYEWYATVSDCAHEVRTPVRQFTGT